MRALPRPRSSLLRVVPSMVTLGNAVCGFAAITLVIDAEAGAAGALRLSQAGLFLIAGMILDAIDGGVARLLKQTSEFGAQLDSLCDLVSFGVAPALMMMKFSQGLPPQLVWAGGLIYLLCVVSRLARYNVEHQNEFESRSWFRGLPSPAAAGTIASFLIAWPALTELATTTADPVWQASLTKFTDVGPLILLWMTLALAFLMVSRIRYAHVVEQLRDRQRLMVHVLLLYVAILAFVAVSELALPLVFVVYSTTGPLRAVAWAATPIIVRQIRPVLR